MKIILSSIVAATVATGAFAAGHSAPNSSIESQYPAYIVSQVHLAGMTDAAKKQALDEAVKKDLLQ